MYHWTEFFALWDKCHSVIVCRTVRWQIWEEEWQNDRMGTAVLDPHQALPITPTIRWPQVWMGSWSHSICSVGWDDTGILIQQQPGWDLDLLSLFAQHMINNVWWIWLCAHKEGLKLSHLQTCFVFSGYHLLLFLRCQVPSGPPQKNIFLNFTWKVGFVMSDTKPNNRNSENILLLPWVHKVS